MLNPLREMRGVGRQNRVPKREADSAWPHSPVNKATFLSRPKNLQVKPLLLLVTKELTRLAPGRPCGPTGGPVTRANSFLSEKLWCWVLLDRSCSWTSTFLLASLSLMDSQGKGQQNRRKLPLVTKDNSLCPSCLGGWNPAFGIFGGPSTPQPHEACLAIHRRCTQASPSSYAKETGNFY